MASSSDVYLNTLCLAAWAPGQSSMKIAQAVAQMFDELSVEERTMVTPINKLYVKLIKEAIGGKLDLSNRSEAQNTLMQYQDDPAFSTNKFTFNELKDMLTPEQLPGQSKIRQLFTKVKNHIVWAKNARKLRMLMIANQRAAQNDDPEKQKEMLRQILDDAAEFTAIYNSQEEEDGPGLPLDEIDFTDISSINKGLKQQHQKNDGPGIRFGWAGLNNMFGPKRAACYGEVMAFAAASHCGKSLILQSMALSHCLYNDPPDTGGHQPVVLFISLENEVGENMLQIWKTMYVNMYHKEPTDLKDEEVGPYLKQELSRRGFRFLLIRKLGETFGYREYNEYIEKLEKTGCKVVAVYMDYITLARHDPNDSARNDAKQIELMVERFKDHAKRHNLFFCTAFQLDAEAARIKLSGQTNAVKRFNESTLSDCKSALKPLDILYFNDIEVNHTGASYLCFAWRKHRYVHDTAKEDKYCAYRFGPLGILFDIDGQPQFTRDIYAEDADPNADGPEQQVSIF